MTNITKPTVGRKVWYRPSEWDQRGPNAMIAAHGQPLDATVVAVHSERMVNLVVFDYSGNMHKKTSTKMLQEGDEVPCGIDGENAGGYAEWMPYQLKQHAKDASE